MSDAGGQLAEAALDLVGARYRLHGRDPRTGLDCVGLLVASLERIGRQLTIPPAYGLRNASIAHLLTCAEPAQALSADGMIATGDILLARPGPAQHHMLIAARPDLFVHAHAGLRRVVAMPGPLPWPILARWRLT